MAQPPRQSVVGGIWTDPDSGTVYQQDNLGRWTPISSGNIQNTGGLGIQDLLNQIIGSPNSVIQPNYPAGSFDVTPFSQFYDQAFKQLAPYYKQLLDEAGGDVKVALGNLEQDYQIGKRTKLEDFQASMDKLGITFPQEQTALQGSLNQRGIALTETPSGKLQYAGGGQAATEVGRLNEDQRLRQEALDRTKQRGLESAAITKVRGEQGVQQQYRNITEGLRSEQEQRATQLGGQYQSADISQKQAGIAKAQVEAQTGVSSNNKSGNWMDYYKGWNPEAAQADFNTVYGGDLGKLQISKPL